VLDEPEEYLPDALPRVELLLVLPESAGMTDLTPDLVERSGAEAVILAVDKRSWAPPGLLRQVKRRLEALHIASAMPTPFCTLTPSAAQHPAIHAFAQQYGRPELACAVENGHLASCDVLRETPCGNTRYIAAHLAGVERQKAAEQAGLLHHYYPCWGGMETDPVQKTHTLLHIAATMAQRSVERALEKTIDRKET
jgi:thymidylate synthase